MTHGLIVYKTSRKEEKPEAEKMEKNLIELRNQIESEVYDTYSEDPDEDLFEYWEKLEKEQGTTDRSNRIGPRFIFSWSDWGPKRLVLVRTGSELLISPDVWIPGKEIERRWKLKLKENCLESKSSEIIVID